MQGHFEYTNARIISASFLLQDSGDLIELLVLEASTDPGEQQESKKALRSARGGSQQTFQVYSYQQLLWHQLSVQRCNVSLHSYLVVSGQPPFPSHPIRPQLVAKLAFVQPLSLCQPYNIRECHPLCQKIRFGGMVLTTNVSVFFRESRYLSFLTV